MRPLSDILTMRAGDFDDAALELFRYQSERCAPYAEYLSLMGIDPSTVDTAERIPYMPVELFKSTRIYCGKGDPEKVFTSSSTTGSTPSRHFMEHLADYTAAFEASFRRFYGDVSDWSFYGLLPSYLERDGSSLVYMVDGLIKSGRGGGFYLHDTSRLLDDLRSDTGKKILIGVTYALLDLAEQYAPDLSDTVVMETGGMKGHRKELSKAELHATLCRAFHTSQIHSEYGMAELTSQAYSHGQGIFRAPEWMRVSVREPNNPLDLHRVGRGGINIADLTNRSSVGFIQTQDMGEVYADGSFSLLGRIAHADIRGCNLLVQ